MLEHAQQREVVDDFQAAGDDEGPAERGLGEQRSGDGRTDGGREAAGHVGDAGGGGTLGRGDDCHHVGRARGDIHAGQEGADQQAAHRQLHGGHEGREDEEAVGGKVGEDHGAHQSDAFRQTGGRQEGDRGEQTGDEEDGAGGAGGELELLEEPERDHRLHGDAAREGIETEERRQPVDDPAGFLERGFLRWRGFQFGRQPVIEHERRHPQRRIAEEHDIDGLLERDAGIALVDPFRQPRGERAHRGHQRADHAVAGKKIGALLIADGARQERLLGGEEDADITGRGVERADEGDQQQRPEVVDEGEPEPGDDGEHRAADEQFAQVQPVGDQPDQQGERGRAEHGGGGDHADLHRAESQLDQVQRQQHADEAVAKGAHTARGQQGARVPSGAGGQDAVGNGGNAHRG